jgi:hypothetical protein
MPSQDTGGYAFPNDFKYPENKGMSLRDWFAGQALTGVLATSHRESPALLARWSYEIADAMLKERQIERQI